MIKVIQNPTQEEIDIFEKFSDENWGNHCSIGNPELEFFDLHRLIFENYKEETLVSGLVVFFKTLVFKEKILNVAGIGGVVTHRDHRRKGYAFETLKFMVDYLKARNVDAAMLCTEIDKLGGLYGKAGFVPLGKPYYFLDKNGKKTEEIGGMIANLGNNEAFDFILNAQEEIFVGRSNF